MKPTQLAAGALCLAELTKSASDTPSGVASRLPGATSNPMAVAAVLGALGLMGIGGGLRAALPGKIDKEKGRGALKRFAIGAGQGAAVGAGAFGGGAFGRNLQDTIAGDDPVQNWLPALGYVGGGLGMNSLYSRAIGDR